MPKVTNITTYFLLNNTKYIYNTSLHEIKHHIDITSSILIIILCIFCVITVCGNGLVIYAVIQERYLKSGIVFFKKKRCFFIIYYLFFNRSESIIVFFVFPLKIQT